MWRQKFYNMRHVSLHDFFCLHRTRVRPDYVLKHIVSLYSVTTKDVIFVETAASVMSIIRTFILRLCGTVPQCNETLPGTLVINEPDTVTNVYNLRVY